MKKVQGVSLKWKPTDTEWIKARPTTITNFTQDKSRYATEQPESDPLYLVYDKSLNVFPAPTDTGTLKMYGISDPTDLQTAGNEASVKIPLDFHHLIVLGNEYRIHKYLRNLGEKNDSLVEYENGCMKMIEQLSDRITQPLESEMPYLNNLA